MMKIKKIILSTIAIAAMLNVFTINTYAMTAPAYIYISNGSKKETIPKSSDNINYDTIINASNYISTEKKIPYLVHFNKTLSTGKTENNITVDCETEYGLQGYIDNNNIYIRIYDHTSVAQETKTIFRNLSTKSEFKIDLGNKYSLINISNKQEGLYEINTVFKKRSDISIYIYITKSKNIYFCDIMNSSKTAIHIYQQRRKSLNSLTNNVDPSDNLDYKTIEYPVRYSNSRYRNDVELWALKTEELCDPSDSDSYKVYKIYKYLINNISYDYYRVENLHKSRASYYSDYSGQYSTYALRTGVCLDFANILTIMCRYQGIPTITIGSESRNHVWNAVYINNYWYELDASGEALYGSYEQNSEIKTFREKTPYIFFFNFLPHKRADMPDDATINKYLL